jgi:N-acyl-D-aspartate/D-glutamate deacylase
MQTYEEKLAYNKRYHAINSERIAARRRAQRENTKEAQREYAQRYYIENAERRLASARAWHAKNKGRVAERHRRWREEKPHYCAAQVQRRAARKLQATPSWADDAKILTLYAEAARLTRETGVRHEVDHIVPLRSKVVCGLHCEANLQILTKAENVAKYNYFSPDDPLPPDQKSR